MLFYYKYLSLLNFIVNISQPFDPAEAPRCILDCQILSLIGCIHFCQIALSRFPTTVSDAACSVRRSAEIVLGPMLDTFCTRRN